MLGKPWGRSPSQGDLRTLGSKAFQESSLWLARAAHGGGDQAVAVPCTGTPPYLLFPAASQPRFESTASSHSPARCYPPWRDQRRLEVQRLQGAPRAPEPPTNIWGLFFSPGHPFVLAVCFRVCFFLRLYLFIHERQTERERERDRQREKQASMQEAQRGTRPGSPGSHPRLKAGAKPLGHQGCP